ncbi:MAG: tetratricopeptide repeat protein [Gemmatimonadota bacterium]|nr:tetratricopeptide repeat protein [Gemmatimonadota bacterium]MDP6803198.1 tetratricopeptide repeat protein [Gemmatimonadota bacterium]MDP7031264.1 tetratricopeptide repeat protein [Gemmatimonadota bacterium]
MRRFITLAAMLAVVAGSGCAYYNTLYNARKKFDEAQEIKRNADEEREEIGRQEINLYEESFERAARVVKFYPESKWVDDALLLMARVSFEKSDYSAAVRKCREILVFFPDSELVPEALLMLGRTHLEAREYAEAVASLEKMLVEVSDGDRLRGDAAYFLGRVQFEQGDREAAHGAYLEVVEHHAESDWFAEAGLALGEMAMEDSSATDAAGFFKRVWDDAQIVRDRFRAGMRRGDALIAMGELKRARSAFDEIAHGSFDEKRRGKALLRKAEVCRALGEEDEAISIYEGILEEMARREAAAAAQLALAEMVDESGDLEAALEAYEKVKEQGTGHPAWREASERRTRIQRVMDLQNTIGGLAEEDPERLRNRFLLAEEYLESIGDVDRALTEYAALAEDAPGTLWGGKALYSTAWIHEYRLDQPDTAEVLLYLLANHYSGTDVADAARGRFGFPIWRARVLDVPRVSFVRPEGEESTPVDIVVERAEPREAQFPEGDPEAVVWVRVWIDEDGSPAETKVVRSGGEDCDAASVEAATGTRFLPPDEGGAPITVLRYVFGPKAKAGGTGAAKDSLKATLPREDATLPPPEPGKARSQSFDPDARLGGRRQPVDPSTAD